MLIRKERNRFLTVASKLTLLLKLKNRAETTDS